MTTSYMLEHVRETEQGDDEDKFIGVYSSEEKAKTATERLKGKPGFREYPEGFKILADTLDETSWEDGFIAAAEATWPNQ